MIKAANLLSFGEVRRCFTELEQVYLEQKNGAHLAPVFELLASYCPKSRQLEDQATFNFSVDSV